MFPDCFNSHGGNYKDRLKLWLGISVIPLALVALTTVLVYYSSLIGRGFVASIPRLVYWIISSFSSG